MTCCNYVPFQIEIHYSGITIGYIQIFFGGHISVHGSPNKITFTAIDHYTVIPVMIGNHRGQLLIVLINYLDSSAYQYFIGYSIPYGTGNGSKAIKLQGHGLYKAIDIVIPHAPFPIGSKVPLLGLLVQNKGEIIHHTVHRFPYVQNRTDKLIIGDLGSKNIQSTQTGVSIRRKIQYIFTA